MSFKRAPYPQAFRRQMVDLVRSGRTPEELSREFEPSAQSIRDWVAAAELGKVGAMNPRAGRSATNLWRLTITVSTPETLPLPRQHKEAGYPEHPSENDFLAQRTPHPI